MGFEPKRQNRAIVARFWARRVKRRLRTVHRGGVVVRTRWGWWWGGAFVKREAGMGFEPNI